MNNGAFPLFGYVSKPVDLLFRQITPWFATHILQYDYDHSVGITGSGDTSYAWVTLLIIGTPKTWAVDFVDVYLS